MMHPLRLDDTGKGETKYVNDLTELSPIGNKETITGEISAMIDDGAISTVSVDHNVVVTALCESIFIFGVSATCAQAELRRWWKRYLSISRRRFRKFKQMRTSRIESQYEKSFFDHNWSVLLWAR